LLTAVWLHGKIRGDPPAAGQLDAPKHPVPDIAKIFVVDPMKIAEAVG